MRSLSQKVLIGSASFGMSYGIANFGPPSAAEISKILEIAITSGLGGVDTARDYSGAEEQVGLARIEDLRVFSKFSHGTKFGDYASLKTQVADSRKRLGIRKLAGFSSHSYSAFMESGQDGVRNLARLKEDGEIDSWGVSLYEPNEFFDLLDLAKPDYVQIPMSAVDQRFISSGALKLANELGIYVHARSIFLQGALLLPIDSLPETLAGLGRYIKELEIYAQSLAVSLPNLLLAQILRNSDVQQVAVGINSVQQILDIVSFIESGSASSKFENLVFDDCDPYLIDPRRWQW